MAFEKTSNDDSELSLEQSYLKVYWRALDNLQSCWMNETGFDREKFNQQLLFLIRLLPDRTIQQKIMEAWAKGLVDIKGIEDLSLTKDEIVAYAGMEIVTETVLFIGKAFELINEDITGPSTAKEYQRMVIEIPDFEPAKPDETTDEDAPSMVIQLESSGEN